MRRVRIKPAGWLALLFLISFLGMWKLNKPSSHKLKLGRPLRVGIAVWPGYAAGIYANGGLQASGNSFFYRDCGLDVEFGILNDADDSRDAAFSPHTADGRPNPKSFDVVWSTIDFAAYELPRLRKKDPTINPKVFLQLDWSHGGDAIVVDNRIQNINDLKDRTVSLAKRGPSRWLLDSALDMQGLREANIKLEGTEEPGQAENKFEHHGVDAAVLWEPYVTAAVHARPDDSHVLLSTRAAANLIADVFVAREDFIEEDSRRGVLDDFCRCWLKAAQDVMQRPSRAVEPLMKAYKNLSQDALFKTEKETRHMLDLVALAGPAENAELFGLYRNRREKHPLFDIIFMKALGLISDDRSFSPDDAKDTSILERLLSPLPPSIMCQATNPRDAVLSKVFKLEGPKPTRDEYLHELADTAQTYSHACISLEGPNANVAEVSLMDSYKLDPSRFLVQKGGSADRGTVYVPPDAVVERNTPQQARDDDLLSRRDQR